MAYSLSIRFAAVALRKKGYSLKEISEQFRIAKSTASLWVRDVPLGYMAEKRLLTVMKRGQLISAANKRAKTKRAEEIYFQEALNDITLGLNFDKVMCAMLYWCEGSKRPNGVAFTNSNPDLVKTFLKLFRKSFTLDESKFRPCIHLHEYHSREKQLDFWAKITDINKRQFIKPYRKPHTGKRVRENYQGCISVVYHSSELARRLMAIAKAYLYYTGA